MLYFPALSFFIFLMFITAVCVLLPIKLRKFNHKVTLQRGFFLPDSRIVRDSEARSAKREREITALVDPSDLSWPWLGNFISRKIVGTAQRGVSRKKNNGVG